MSGVSSIISDGSDDVMAGIFDDDEDTEVSSVSTNPFAKLMPTALAPTGASGNELNPIGLRLPQNEKGVDRLLLKVKYPNAEERDIEEALRRREVQQQAASILASKKGELFRQKQQEQDAERWKQQQERERLKQEKIQQQERERLKQEQMQQQERERLKQEQILLLRQQQNAMVSPQDSMVRVETKQFQINNNHATNILPQRSKSTDDEIEFDNAMMWQAATGDNDRIEYKNSMGDEEQQQSKTQKDSQTKNEGSNSIVEKTRKSISSVFGGATKFLGNVLPLAAADGNALVDSSSVNTAYGDNRSVASSKVSQPTSQASLVTHKASNIQPAIRLEMHETELDDHPVNYSTERNSIDEENKSSRHWIRDRKKNKMLICIFTMIIVVAIIVTVLAVVIGRNRRTSINASDSPENQRNGDVDTVGSFPFPSQSPTNSEISASIDRDTLPTLSPIEDIDVISTPVEEDTEDQDNNEIESSTASPSTPTKSSFDTNSPSSVPTAAPTEIQTSAPSIPPTNLPTSAPTNEPSNNPTNTPTKEPTNSPTNEPTNEPSINPTKTPTKEPTKEPTNEPTNKPTNEPTYSPTKEPTYFPTTTPFPTIEQDFLDWEWFEEGGDGILLQGNPDTDQHFGQSIALSQNGQKLVVGAPDSLDGAGIVRIYEQSNGSWDLVGSLAGRNEGDQFGDSIALSADGRVLAVSEPSFNGEAGDTTGNVRTFIDSPFGYIPMASDIEGENPTDQFGTGLALSSDGRRLAIGAPYRDGGFGIRAVPGMARVFEWSNTEREWIPIGTNLAGNDHRDWFGWSVDLNDNGTVLCVGAPKNSDYGGYVRCFEEDGRSANLWKQIGKDIRNEDGVVRYDDNFGSAISVSSDPSGTRYRVAIGAPGKNSDNIFDAGQVVVYEFNPSTAKRGWVRLGREVLALENPDRYSRMGLSLDLNEDLLAVGIPGENSGAGKVEIFEFQRENWTWLRNPTVFDGGASGSSNFGAAISMTPSGDFVAGSPEANDNVGSISFYRRKIPRSYRRRKIPSSYRRKIP